MPPGEDADRFVRLLASVMSFPVAVHVVQDGAAVEVMRVAELGWTVA